MADAARKAIQDKTIIPIVFVQPVLDDFLDESIGHQFASGHETLDPRRHLGVALDVPAKNVADTDVGQVKRLDQQFRLCAFASAALDAQR